MKRNRKNYEMMANGWLEALRDYDWGRYSTYEYSHDGNWINRAAEAVRFMDRHFSSLEEFLTTVKVSDRVEEIWKKHIILRKYRVSMAYCSDGVTELNIVRSMESFTKIFQEISRFFSWNGEDEKDGYTDVKITVGKTLQECVHNLNKYLSTVRVVHYSGPDSVIWFLIGIGYIVKEVYNNSSISDFFKLKFTRDEYENIKRDIWGLADYPEFHTEEDDKFIKRLPFNAKSNVDDIFKMQYHDTGLDIIFCMKSDSIKGVMENLDKIREMHDRWRDAHYEASPKYVASNSNAHAYQLESSYDIMSDD